MLLFIQCPLAWVELTPTLSAHSDRDRESISEFEGGRFLEADSVVSKIWRT